MHVSVKNFAMRPSLPLLVVVLLAICLIQCSRAAEIDEIHRLQARVIELRDQSKWIEAMPIAERLVKLIEEKHGKQSVEAADALHLWAWLVQHNGDFQKAEQLWLRALAIDESIFGKDTIQTARRLHLLANFYREQRDFDKAAPLLNRALAVRERHLGPDHVETGQILHSLGDLYLSSGDFASAEATLLRAVKVFEGSHSLENMAGTLSTLGWLYLDLGDYEAAERVMNRSLTLRKELHGLEHESVSASFRELAMVHRGSWDLKKAELLFNQSLHIRERLFGTNHIMVSEILDDLGETYLDSGDFPKAENALKRARTIVETTLGVDDPRVAGMLMEFSRLSECRGDYTEAYEFCSRAYSIRQKRIGPLHHLTIWSLKHMARLESLLGERTQALASAALVQQSEECLLSNILSFTSERQRLAFQSRSFLFRHTYDLWADMGAIKPLLQTVLRTKGVILDSLIEDRRLLDATHDSACRTTIVQVSELRERLESARSMSGIISTNRRGEAMAISAQIETLESSLARRISGLGRARRALTVQVDQVLSAIPEDAVLLEVVRYDHYEGKAMSQPHYGVLILSHSDDAKWVSLGSAKEIDRTIELFQHAVRSSDRPAILLELLHNLYDQIWVPLALQLPVRTKRVIVSPDGELNFVSFATLLESEATFLGEKYLFSYVSSGRDIIPETHAPSVIPQLLVWANPDFANGAFQASSGCKRDLRDFNFTRLPGAEKEGRILFSQARQLGFSNAVLYLGTNATEAELRRVHSPHTLHLATHGFVLPFLGEPQNLDLASFGAVARSRPNVMSRCGLALAGARRAVQAWSEGKRLPVEDDGIVTAEEISGLDLRGTKLVVLAACDTGIGEVRAGEGVLGLRRAFIQAGAQKLLLTLWPIDDERTAGLLPLFYSRMHERWSSDTLAEVQRKWLAELRSEKGIAEACRIAGPFIMSFQGSAN